MQQDDIPLWIECLALLFLGLVNFMSAAYESALQDASRSRILKIVEKRGLPPDSFPARAASNDASILARVELLYVMSTALFMAYGLWYILRDDGKITLSGYAWEAAIVILCLFLLRMAASSAGDHYSARLVVGAARPMALLSLPFAPLAKTALAAEKVFSRAVGVDDEDEDGERAIEVIDAVSDASLDGVVEDGQKEMIEGIFEIKDADVADIIVPRTEMTTIDAESPLSDAIAIALEKGYSRLPAYRGNRDHIVGIFVLRDAFKYWDQPAEERPPLSALLRPPLFVPETKLISELLAEMRRGQSHMAVVLDEYGGTAGLVTIEDVLEEIVGDIQDEFDSTAANHDGKVRKLEDESLIADGNAHVSAINKMFGLDIIPEDDDYETAAGFVLDNFGHIPKAGENFLYEDKLSVRVLQADERRVKRVKMRLTTPEE